MLLLSLYGRGPGLDKCVLNWPGDIWGKYRPCIHRSRYGLLPGFEHLIHLPPNAIVDQGVCFHEGRIQLAAKEKGVWSSDIFDHRIEYVEGGQLFLRGGLQNVSKDSF